MSNGGYALAGLGLVTKKLLTIFARNGYWHSEAVVFTVCEAVDTE